MLTKLVLLALVATSVSAIPAKDAAKTGSIWKGTPLEELVEGLKKECKKNMDSLACVKYQLFDFVDDVSKKDFFKVSQSVSVVRNSEAVSPPTDEARGHLDWVDALQNYVKSHDVQVKLPSASLTLSPRHLDQDEVTLSLKLDRESSSDVGEARKAKLKRILIPVLVFVLLKALTLVPLFIGALGLKAWNALQLSFFSFIISVGLAVFQLCKKIASDGIPHIATTHAAWNPHYGRSLDSHDLAYRSHGQMS